ncbi:hypothetical protein C5167_044407 [Papaver somniferum]|uniref:Uncharacterized protein n=1 Tax=Papaver somniferum TaxID=3469 RepID=A0A4Y7LC92_PAPSO|nr:hypothetical protein C5167_044407 [Papaver somniferum]
MEEMKKMEKKEAQLEIKIGPGSYLDARGNNKWYQRAIDAVKQFTWIFYAVVKVIYESGEEEHRFVEEWIVLNLKKRRLLMLYSLSRRRGGNLYCEIGSLIFHGGEVLIYSIKMVKFTAEELSRIMDL